MVNQNLMLTDNLNAREQEIINANRSPYGYMEQCLGRGLNQPNNSTNSGARKILFSTQYDQHVQVKNAEVPYIQTGYENEYGERSSSIIAADTDLEVVKKISKFSFAPNQIYYLILYDKVKNQYGMIKRTECEHTTESHGYTYNNRYMDSLAPGQVIPKDKVIRKSTAFDEYGDRKDGSNLRCQYIGSLRNTEDSVILSVSGAQKLTTTKIKKLSITINDNDIPLNIHGTKDYYKCIPDIGEESKDGILMSIRREDKEHALYTQSSNRLSNIFISDEKKTVTGTVIDIDIFSNNTDILQGPVFGQLNRYYEESIRFASELKVLIEFIAQDNPTATLTYELEELYSLAVRILKKDKIDKDGDGKIFSSIYMEVLVAEDCPVEVGDKVTDRHGGKGVVSFILPDFLMPMDDTGHYADAIINKSTCIGRENPGQLFEHSVNHISERIVLYLKKAGHPVSESLAEICKFLYIVAPTQGDEFAKYVESLDYDSAEQLLLSIFNDGIIIVSALPISEAMTQDKLEMLYDTFPYIDMSYLQSPITNSMGKVRYVRSRRRIVSSYKYMYRLKQFADDKFSATSLSSTNIKNQNTRSKSAKNYSSIHSNTPIAMGTMEVDGLCDMGMEYVISMLMLLSVSPQARRLCEEMLTGEAFNVDIKLDDLSTNRSVEILNAYLKAHGNRFEFTKKLKVVRKVIKPIYMSKNVINRVQEGEQFDYLGYYKAVMETNMKRANSIVKSFPATLPIDNINSPSFKAAMARAKEVIDKQLNAKDYIG